MPRNKDELTKLTENWFKSSNRIFQMDLDASVIAVYLFLCTCSEQFHPSVRVIAAHVKLSKATVSRALRELVDRNILACVREKRGFRTQYSFVSPEEWR